MSKLLVLVSPDGDAMLREVYEMVLAIGERHDVLVLAATTERGRYVRAGIGFARFRPAGFVGMATSISTLRKSIERFKPDVIHAHGFPAVAAAIGTMPASLAARTIVTYHDPQRDRELPEKLVDRKFPGYMQRAGAVTVAYPTLSRRLEDRAILGNVVADVIPHGVSVSADLPLARPPARPGPVVGWNGRLAADRAWETAIDAFALVRERFPDARLELAGTGRARQFIAAHVREKKIADAVVFRGDVAPHELFATIDMLVVPVSRDAMPHAPLEALVAGIPVIAANAGGLADVLGDCDTAWLVPDDAEGFRDGILDAWSRIEAAWDGAAAQRDAARATYARETIRDAYEALYERVASVRSNSSTVSAHASSVTAGT